MLGFNAMHCIYRKGGHTTEQICSYFIFSDYVLTSYQPYTQMYKSISKVCTIQNKLKTSMWKIPLGIVLLFEMDIS